MANENHRPLVVCVDDDEAVLATVVRCLQLEPFEIRSTMSASEALGWISSEDVAVLVSDYDMPEMTGAELARHALQLRPETVRILLTGKRSLEAAVEGINQGEIMRFLSKPLDSKQLRVAVRAAVERNRELVAMSSSRQRRQRREGLVTELEAEFPGISHVVRRADDVYEVVADPWSASLALGLLGLSAKLENS